MSDRLITVLLRLFVVGATAALAGCQGYDYTINDKVVYRAGPLFTDFSVADSALQTCLQQAIEDNSITAPSQLKRLNCSHAGIESLQGLAVFSAITALRLSDNKIRNLVELGSLPALTELYLDNNNVVDPVPLYRLPLLLELDLSGNEKLQCPASGKFSAAANVILPEHCAT